MTCTWRPASGVAGGGDRTGECLAFAGGHLDDVACQHPQGALQLNVERAQAGRALGGLAGDRQELRDVGGFGQVVEVEQLRGLAQLLVVELGGLLVELGRVAAPRVIERFWSCRCWRPAASRSGPLMPAGSSSAVSLRLGLRAHVYGTRRHDACCDP